MSDDKNYNKILEEVCEKLNGIDSIKDLDLLDIKNSIESVENLLTDTQAKLNFQEIKEKLENIAFQVGSCNETLLKDLFNDMNQIKEKSENIGTYLENIQNVQNLSMTSAEFEEYQKQQLDLALKTNENIFNELKQLKEKTTVVDNTPQIKNLETKLTDLHKTLSLYIEQLVAKIDTAAPGLEEISAVINDASSVNQQSIKQTNNLVKVLESNFNNFKNKEFSEQISKISEIYDSLNIIHAWIEKVGFLNKSIENVYARLGANIDFDDVSEKVDIIYENITALNDWTMKIDKIDTNMSDIHSKTELINSCIEETKKINESISNMKSKFDSTFFEDLDFEDISNKMDIVYENLTALNDWAGKIDSMSEKVENIDSKITSVTSLIEEDAITSKIDLIYDNISLLNEWVNKIDNIAQKSEELDGRFINLNDKVGTKFEEIAKSISDTNQIIENIPDMHSKLDEVAKELHLITRTTKNETESYIYTLLDIEADFLKLQKFMDSQTQQTAENINALKDKFEEISGGTSEVINSLKDRFEELTDDISSISKRTNKLILTADDANKEFKNHLDSFKATIADFELQKQNLNSEGKLQAIGEKLTGINQLVQNNINTNKNLNTAFMYLAEWIDATGSVLNTINNDITDIKSEIAETKETTKLNSAQNDEISEIKSLLTGIIVQLNTALTPDIDAINERIDKLSEENQNKFSELEILLKEKSDYQAKQIVTLEKKVDNLNGKIEKLIESFGERNNNDEIKDILTYLTSQVSAANETLSSRQSVVEEINKISNEQQDTKDIVNQILTGRKSVVDEITKISNEQKNTNTALTEVITGQQTISKKLSGFDDSVNKIVSYIEEE